MEKEFTMGDLENLHMAISEKDKEIAEIKQP